MALQPRDMNIPESEQRVIRRPPPPLPRIDFEGKEAIAEKILDKRITAKGEVQYLIKFKGIPVNCMTSWEPLINLRCPRLIRNFEYNRKRSAVIMNMLPEETLVVEKIDGITTLDHQLFVTVMFTNKKMDVIPMSKALKMYPKEMFAFFKNNIVYVPMTSENNSIDTPTTSDASSSSP